MITLSEKSTPKEVMTFLRENGVDAVTQNDFTSFRTLANGNHGHVSAEYKSKTNALIAKFPALSEFNAFLTAIGK